MKTYNKLVRDNIPKIIKNAGKDCEIEILDQERYLIELKKKMVEESNELVETNTKEELIEELADIYEVLETILIQENVDIKDIQDVRIKKNIEKGAFDSKVFLVKVK